MDYNIKNMQELLTNPSKISYREYSTGHKGLDGMLTINQSLEGIRTSRLYTILGCTGSGKSLFMLTLSQSLSQNNCNVLYISLENTEDQTLERLAGLPVSDSLYLSHPTKNPNFGINDAFYPDDIKQEILEVQNRYNTNIDVVILDYLGEIKPTSGRNSYEELGNIMIALKDIAKELNIAIITASQCNREALKTYKTASTKQDMISALCNINESHVSDSAKIIHISDFVWFVHRIKQISFESYNKGKSCSALFISVLKNRDFSSNYEKIVIPFRNNVNALSNTFVDLSMEV